MARNRSTPTRRLVSVIFISRGNLLSHCPPALVGGALGLGGLAYMASQYRHRPAGMKPSVYLIHTRLVAQGAVIGVLTLGMLVQAWRRAAE